MIKMVKHRIKRSANKHTEINNSKAEQSEPNLGAEALLHELSSELDKPISDVYPVIDTDLARDNVENDLTAADLQDL